jgi:hypothetical protein
MVLTAPLQIDGLTLMGAIYNLDRAFLALM